MKKMLKKVIAILICTMTVFGLTPAVFVAEAVVLKTGYSYNKEGDYYYVDDKTLIDDSYSRFDIEENLEVAVLMRVDEMNFMFEADGKKWLISLFDGLYGFIFVGAEVSVLVADGEVDSFSDFTYVDESEMPFIQLEHRWDKDNDGAVDVVTSTPYEKFRYANIIKKGTPNEYTPFNDLKTKVKFGFKSEEFTKAFVSAAKSEGFTETFDSRCLNNDSFYVDGTTVVLNWSTLNKNDNYCTAELSEKEFTLAPEQSKTVDVKNINLTWSDPSVTWSSSDKSIATVDENGKITAVSFGTATIRANINGCTRHTVEITVKDDSLGYYIYKTNEYCKGMISKTIEYLCKIYYFTY